MLWSEHGDDVSLLTDFLSMDFFASGLSCTATKQTKLCISGFQGVTDPNNYVKDIFIKN